MEYLFTIEKQYEMFNRAERLYIDGSMAEAESIYYLTLESALQNKDYPMYIASLLKLNSILINSQRYDLVFQNLEYLKTVLDDYGSEEQKYLYKNQHIIFNYVNGLTDPIAEFEQLYAELVNTPHHKLLLKVVNNLLDTYYEYNHYDKGVKLYHDMYYLYEESVRDDSYDSSPFVFLVNAFRLFYANQDFETCQFIVNKIESNNVLERSATFKLLYWSTKALLELQIGEFERAKSYFYQFESFVTSPYYFLMDIELWIEALKQKGHVMETIPYLEMALQAVKSFVKNEEHEKRSQLIKQMSKGHYEKIMYTDYLTEVNNRNYYEDLLSKELKQKHMTLAVLDIDYFKKVNDTYGHVVGDQAIRFLGKHLKEWCPRHDISLIRYGGDEFIIVMPYAVEEMRPLLCELHEKVWQTPFFIYDKNESIHISLSIGIGYCEDEYASLYELFVVADQALYKAKKERGIMAELQFNYQ